MSVKRRFCGLGFTSGEEAQQLSNYLSISRNTALRKLSRLIDAKKLKKIGKSPGIKYVATQL